MSIEKIKDDQGKIFEYEKVDNPKYGFGKTSYFTTDNKYVLSFFDKNLITPENIARLKRITVDCKNTIFNKPGGDFFKEIFSWPESLINERGILATVSQVYPKQFFFNTESPNDSDSALLGSLKEPYWYASAFNFNTYVPRHEKGNLLGFLNVALNLSRGINKLHEFDLLPSNLSFNNCLIDPVSGGTLIREIAHLRIPDYKDLNTLESLEFLAPDLITNKLLNSTTPSPHTKETDRHALAVLIYYFLFHRHPLIGSAKYHDDSDKNKLALLGEKPIFIENPNDTSNALSVKDYSDDFLPWIDTTKLPYTISGEYLSDLFKKSFIDGLTNPALRPTPEDWINAIINTRDLLYPCSNKECSMKQFVFNPETRTCPYCGTKIDHDKIPCLTLTTNTKDNQFNDHHKLIIYTDRFLYPWNIKKSVKPNEFLTPEQKRPVGYFSFYNNKWSFTNKTLDELFWFDANDKSTKIPTNQKIDLKPGLILSLAPSPDGYYARVDFI
jgi:hypothetical protein